MKNVIAVLLTASVSLTGVLASASAGQAATTTPWGTVSLSIEGAQVSRTPGCQYIQFTANVAWNGSNSPFGYGYDDVWVSPKLIRPDGTIADSEFLTIDWPATSTPGSFQLCDYSDPAGTYSLLGEIEFWDTDFNNSTYAMTPSGLTYTNPPAPPPPPAPVVPAPVYADVTGTVTKKPLASGVRLIFRTNAIPAGTTARNTVRWKVTYDSRTKRISQGPNDKDILNLRFTIRGRHVVKVFRDGTRVLRTLVTVR